MQVEVGKKYTHYNGREYTVVAITNTDSTPERLIKHPPMVVYKCSNGKIWSRPLSDWGMTEVEDSVAEGWSFVRTEDLEEYRNDQDTLRCLEAAGVDNWEGYDSAWDNYREMKGVEE